MNKQENLDLIKEVLQSIPTPEEKSAFLYILGTSKEAKKDWLLHHLPGITEAQRQAILEAVSLTKAERAALAGQAIRAIIFKVLAKLGSWLG